MYPDEHTPTPERYPVDYLNQIAPTPQKKSGGGPSLRLIGLLLGGAVILLIAIMLIASLFSRPDISQQLAARLQYTSEIVEDSHKNIKSSHLRSLNSNLNIMLANANRDLGSHLEARGVNPSKLDESVAKSEKQAADELSAKLEDARLNAVFDRTYARELAYRLETINTYLRTAYENSSNPSYKEFLSDTSSSLGPIYEQISAFNEDGS